MRLGHQRRGRFGVGKAHRRRRREVLIDAAGGRGDAAATTVRTKQAYFKSNISTFVAPRPKLQQSLCKNVFAREDIVCRMPKQRSPKQVPVLFPLENQNPKYRSKSARLIVATNAIVQMRGNGRSIVLKAQVRCKKRDRSTAQPERVGVSISTFSLVSN